MIPRTQGEIRVAAIAVLHLLLTIGLGAAAAADWLATGSAHYRDREFDTTGFTGVEPLLPIRLADVEVLDASSGEVLAGGATDGAGGFSLLVPDLAVRDVYVRVLARSETIPDLHQQVTVAAGDPYAVAGPVVAGHDPTGDLDVGALVAETGAGGEAFNLYDMALLAADYLAIVQGQRPGSSEPLTVVWEADRGWGGSSSSAGTIQMRDSGGYDDTVLLHEYGHYAVLNFSDTDTTGGWHALADCEQDPRLAWDEGHASFFGNSVLRRFGKPRPNIYVRTTGAPGPGNLVLWFDLETETQYQCSGDTSEVAVFTALWDLADGPDTVDDTPGVDDAPVDTMAVDDVEHWEVMSTALPGRSYITAEDYWDSWFEAPVLNGYLTEMIGVFRDGVEIEFVEDSFEPNDEPVDATPLPLDGSPLHGTFFRDPDGDGSGGSILDEDWFVFQAYEGGVYTFETLNLLSAADTEITVYDTKGKNKGDNDDRAEGDPSSYLEWTAVSTATFYLQVVQPGPAAQNTTPYGSYDVRMVPPPDTDGDGLPDIADNCAVVANPGQEDGDADTIGDPCDNCPLDSNGEQEDRDLDGLGDVCDDDRDGDGLENTLDCAPDSVSTSGLPGEIVGLWTTTGAGLAWTDGAQAHAFHLYRGSVLVGQPFTYAHTCLLSSSPERSFADSTEPDPGDLFYYLVGGANSCGGGGLGVAAVGERPTIDPCVPETGVDGDADGVPDLDDSCPTVSDPTQSDGDGDSAGDVCDVCPDVPDVTQRDEDDDGIGDACD